MVPSGVAVALIVFNSCKIELLKKCWMCLVKTEDRFDFIITLVILLNILNR